MFEQAFRRRVTPLLILALLTPGAASVATAQTPTLDLRQPSIVFKVEDSSERLEMTVNTSRILTLGQEIPQVQVNNPNVLQATALSPNEIQVSAKTPGVTQVNLWGADKRVYTIDVIVHGDARELELLLNTTFPKSALKLIPVNNGVLISGNVNKPEDVGTIVRIAEEYYPTVINNMTVVGVQQVLLHVKVMEVSRTKLRALGFDFSNLCSGGDMIVSSISGLIGSATGSNVTLSGGQTFRFDVLSGSSAFFGVLEALRQDNLMKVLAEPVLVTVSGRTASFQSGGEFPILVPQSLGTISIEFKKFGTEVDFVPIVLGNGRIRLEVRPRVSEIDNTRNVTVGEITVPGLRTREVDTAVEMQAGQTLAIAGLVQSRTEAEFKGIPWISEVPYVGAMFRRVQDQTNEIELLVMVTPELVDPMDPGEVPPCGPGMQTTTPTDWEMFMQGYIEVPNCCPGMPGAASGNCGPGGCGGPQGMMIEGTVAPGAVGMSGPHNRHNQYPSSSHMPAGKVSGAGAQIVEAGFIGPIGYDVVK